MTCPVCGNANTFNGVCGNCMRNEKEDRRYKRRSRPSKDASYRRRSGSFRSRAGRYVRVKPWKPKKAKPPDPEKLRPENAVRLPRWMWNRPGSKKGANRGHRNTSIRAKTRKKANSQTESPNSGTGKARPIRNHSQRTSPGTKRKRTTPARQQPLRKRGQTGRQSPEDSSKRAAKPLRNSRPDTEKKKVQRKPPPLPQEEQYELRQGKVKWIYRSQADFERRIGAPPSAESDDMGAAISDDLNAGRTTRPGSTDPGQPNSSESRPTLPEMEAVTGQLAPRLLLLLHNASTYLTSDEMADISGTYPERVFQQCQTLFAAGLAFEQRMRSGKCYYTITARGEAWLRKHGLA